MAIDELSNADDVRADVTAALSALKDDNSAGPTTPMPTADSGDDPNASPTTPLADRPRDEHGRFSAKVEGSEPPVAPTVPDADPSMANAPQPSTAPGAPAGWSAEAKAEFGKLTPAVQAAVLKRESEINDGGARWSEEKRTLLAQFDPVKSISDRHQVPPAEAIKRLAAASDYLDRDPKGFIQWVAAQNKIDLSALAANPQPPQPQTDPVVAELTSKVSRFEQMFEQQQQNEINSTLTQFASAPGHEHFEAIKSDMGYLMLAAHQAGRNLSMADAYEQACWSNPGIRSQMITAQTAAATTAAKQRETADRARRGAISVNGAPAGGITPPPRSDPSASVEDDVRAAFAQLRH